MLDSVRCTYCIKVNIMYVIRRKLLSVSVVRCDNVSRMATGTEDSPKRFEGSTRVRRGGTGGVWVVGWGGEYLHLI
jgi:hypothetical protein